MFRIALTGGIATGKSYVAKRLAEAGVPVVDADQIARDIVVPGTPTLAAIGARFGPSVLRSDGTLDRQRLGEIVFCDPAARRDLEAMTHPAIRMAIDAFFARQPAATPVAVADIPLLYETGREGAFDQVVVVACTPARQLHRLMARDGLTREQAEQRLNAQLPIDEKAERADYVVRTDGTFEETDAQVEKVRRALADMSRPSNR